MDGGCRFAKGEEEEAQTQPVDQNTKNKKPMPDPLKHLARRAPKTNPTTKPG
jgi:hypothetical protein